MDFKSFMTSVEENLSCVKSEKDLRDWIKNYARSIPEEERENFLSYFQKPKSRSHKAKLQEILDWCEKVNGEEIVLSCSSHEEYDSEYWTWDPDWVTEYEDPGGIGLRLKEYYAEAEQAVYDGDYDSASSMYWNLGVLNITAEDEDGMDPVELGVEEMVSEDLVSLDLEKIAALTLYSTYQVYELEERVPRLYGFFSWGMFGNIGIEDMLSAGREPLEDVDEFLEAWIAYLREQNDKYTSRLLIEAVTFQRGDKGLLEEAKRTANSHPALYIKVLEKFFEKEDWAQLKDTGMEALHLMNRNMTIRDRTARLAAAGAAHIGDYAGEREALTEAFYSKATAANYFRVLTCLYRSDSEETAAYFQPQSDRLEIRFLAGDYRSVWDECRKTKVSLGWSGAFIEEGVPMLLVLLHRGDITGSAMQAVVSDMKRVIGYEEEYEELNFAERFAVWKKSVPVTMTQNEEKALLKYLTETIDKRIEAIVGGSHRGSYYKAAKLGSALGEVEESLGKKGGKAARVQKYLAQFPRHRAFKKEIGEFR